MGRLRIGSTTPEAHAKLAGCRLPGTGNTVEVETRILATTQLQHGTTQGNPHGKDGKDISPCRCHLTLPVFEGSAETVGCQCRVVNGGK